MFGTISGEGLRHAALGDEVESHDGQPVLLQHRDLEPVGQPEECEQPALNLDALVVDPLVFDAAADALVPPESGAFSAAAG